MRVYDFLCGCGERFERRSIPSKSETAQCSCGKQAERQFTPNGNFYIPGYASPTTGLSWAEIAPIDDMGHPMGKREAAHVVDRYDPDGRFKQEAHDRGQEERLKQGRMESAKRAGWRDHSRRYRIEV